jgi:hypothetical protein
MVDPTAECSKGSSHCSVQGVGLDLFQATEAAGTGQTIFRWFTFFLYMYWGEDLDSAPWCRLRAVTAI